MKLKQKTVKIEQHCLPGAAITQSSDLPDHHMTGRLGTGLQPPAVNNFTPCPSTVSYTITIKI